MNLYLIGYRGSGKTTVAGELARLLGWKWLDSTYRRMGLTLDPRAQERTETATEELARTLLARLRAGEPLDPLVKEFSEDESSAKTALAIPVTPDSRLVPEFKDLALRLNVGESGLVRTTYGFHVMQRTR